MRRALPLLVAVLAFPSAATASTPALTLTAPKATTYLHQIDFAGRMSPVTADARVHLYRGNSYVASTRVRADGSFRLKVKVGSPGPFQIRWLSARSNPVTVRIRPTLHARLVGPGVTGAPLRLAARLEPAHAGRVRVQVIRSGSVGFDRSFAGEAKVALGTRTAGTVRVRLTTRPAPGWEAVGQVLSATLRPPNLSVGTTDPAVSLLAKQLAALDYAVPSFSSSFSYDFQETVWAFQKVQGLERTGAVDARFWTRLDNPRLPQARYSEPAAHIEVDKTRQVLFEVRDGEVANVAHVSTGATGNTPPGHWYVYGKSPGYNAKGMFDSLYFLRGFAIHGYYSVPSFPASHGCVRTPIWFASGFYSRWGVGTSVYVFA